MENTNNDNPKLLGLSVWLKYPHIERLDTGEVEGILELPNIWIEPKIDGANASVLLDGNGILRAAKRSQVLGDNTEFRGLVAYTYRNQDRYMGFFNKYPNHIIYGEWLCLSGDTVIRKTSGGKNSNYMSLREMYEYLQTQPDDYKYTNKDGDTYRIKRKNWWKRYGFPSIFSLDLQKDKIVPNQIKDIVYSGDKKVYKIKTRKGFTIKSTLEHKFLTNVGWKKLKDIKINDCIAVSDLIAKNRRHRRLGKGTLKIQKLWKKLRTSNTCKKCSTNNSLNIHHKDGNYLNNKLDNLEVLCTDCHRNSYHKRNISCKNLQYSYEFDKIVNIKYVGFEDCYDISMCGGENKANFVAQGFIVHNCKHTIGYYRADAWNKLYAFDILNLETNLFYNPDDRIKMLGEFEIEQISPIAKMSGPIISPEHIKILNSYVEKNKFLIDDPKLSGEGIVIKAFNADGKPYVNKYGRTTWAKIVRPEFKEKHVIEMGVCEKKLPSELEQKFSSEFVTPGRVEKIKQKICTEKNTGWQSKYISELLGRVYYDVFTEELYRFVSKNKVKSLDFKVLQQYVYYNVKQIIGA